MLRYCVRMAISIAHVPDVVNQAIAKFGLTVILCAGQIRHPSGLYPSLRPCRLWSHTMIRLDRVNLDRWPVLTNVANHLVNEGWQFIESQAWTVSAGIPCFLIPLLDVGEVEILQGVVVIVPPVRCCCHVPLTRNAEEIIFCACIVSFDRLRTR